jgi:hypothetical protein
VFLIVVLYASVCSQQLDEGVHPSVTLEQFIKRFSSVKGCDEPNAKGTGMNRMHTEKQSMYTSRFLKIRRRLTIQHINPEILKSRKEKEMVVR